VLEINSYSIDIIMRYKLKKFLVKLRLYFLLDLLRKSRFFSHRFHHQYFNYNFRRGVSKNAKPLSDELLNDLVCSLKADIEMMPTSQWKQIYREFQNEILPYMENNDLYKIGQMLINPTKNNLMYGFDNMAKDLQSPFRLETIFECKTTSDYFLELASFLEIEKMHNPEQIVSPIRRDIEINEVVEKIASLIFPDKDDLFFNPFNGEIGIETRFGIASIRVPASIYQSVLSTKLGDNICEIGPGLGRSAYFSTLLGANKYTLVDIPIPSLVQGHFLMQAFGRENMILNGEKARDKGIHLMTPMNFFRSTDSYDLVVNVDSLTEIGSESASEYIKEISKRSKLFLSINHERNEFTVSDLIRDFSQIKKIYRKKSWMRKGYVEELYKIM